MIRINAPRGLGDAIYLRAVALHLLTRGEGVTVFTRWPEVFDGLPVTILPLAALAEHQDVRHHRFPGRLPVPAGGDEFTMRCIEAGIAERVELRMDWRPRNTALVEDIRRRAAGRRIFVYQPLRRAKNDLQELTTPRREAFARVIAEHADCFRVKLGHPPYVEDDPALGCELDLCGKAFIRDSFDVGAAGDIFFGQHCFVIVMAEAMDKPYICMYARAGLESPQWVSNLTPERMTHKPRLATVVYDD